MKNLNENEMRALFAVIDTCDELDGELFTRLPDVMAKLSLDVFDDPNACGGYVTQLQRKGYLSFEEDDGYGMGIWVDVKPYEVEVKYVDEVVECYDGRLIPRCVYWENVMAKSADEAVQKATEEHFKAHPEDAGREIAFRCCGLS